MSNREALEARWRSINRRLQDLRECRTVPEGDPAVVERVLLAELDDVAYELGKLDGPEAD